MLVLLMFAFYDRSIFYAVVLMVMALMDANRQKTERPDCLDISSFMVEDKSQNTNCLTLTEAVISVGHQPL